MEQRKELFKIVEITTPPNLQIISIFNSNYEFKDFYVIPKKVCAFERIHAIALYEQVDPLGNGQIKIRDISFTPCHRPSVWTRH